jgi:hypothetical protein
LRIAAVGFNSAYAGQGPGPLMIQREALPPRTHHS